MVKKSILLILVVLLSLPALAHAQEKEDPNPITFSSGIETAKQIQDTEIPLVSFQKSWSLTNLIIMCTNILLCIVLFSLLLSDRSADKACSRLWIFFGILAGLLSVILFMLTQDMSLQMDLVDNYTVWLSILLFYQLGTTLYLTWPPSKKAKEKKTH